jgi:hypothetical protein
MYAAEPADEWNVLERSDAHFSHVRRSGHGAPRERRILTLMRNVRERPVVTDRLVGTPAAT